MTKKEAIKTLRELWRETNDSWYEEAYNMAIEALERTDTHECVEMINREDAIIAVRKHRIDIDSPHKIVRKTYEDVIRDLPFELVGNSDKLDRTCAKCKFYTKEQLCVCWSYFGFKPEDYCSRWEERDD